MPLGVGCRNVDLIDAHQGARIPLRLFYPTRETEKSVPIGPYLFDLAVDAPVAGDGLPLAVISHGRGSSALVFRDLAAHLARERFVVALPEHPGNNRDDNSLVDTLANLENRPRHITLTIDAAFADAVVGRHIAPRRVAVIGHSMGGYTALAVAGGRPTAFAHESPDGKACAVQVERDARVRAIVLLAPATVWFKERDALGEIDSPILMRTAEKDQFAPGFHADIVTGGIGDTDLIDHRVVPGAGHFSFLSVFPPEMTRPDFPPSQDPAGFDRSAFHKILNGEIVAFLRRVL